MKKHIDKRSTPEDPVGWICEPNTNGYFKEMGSYKEWCCTMHSQRWTDNKEKNKKLSKSDQ